MANGHGGAREGAGRKSTKHEYVDDGELSPLQYLLDLMRNKRTRQAIKIEAAKAALPYCSARLISADIQADTSLEIYLISQLADIPAESDAA